jgi:hypothetical protein
MHRLPDLLIRAAGQGRVRGSAPAETIAASALSGRGGNVFALSVLLPLSLPSSIPSTPAPG